MSVLVIAEAGVNHNGDIEIAFLQFCACSADLIYLDLRQILKFLMALVGSIAFNSTNSNNNSP